MGYGERASAEFGVCKAERHENSLIRRGNASLAGRIQNQEADEAVDEEHQEAVAVDLAAVTGEGEEAAVEDREAVSGQGERASACSERSPTEADYRDGTQASAVTEEDAVVVEALLEAGEAVTAVVEVVVEDGEHLVADEVEQLAAQRVRRLHLCRLASNTAC